MTVGGGISRDWLFVAIDSQIIKAPAFEAGLDEAIDLDSRVRQVTRVWVLAGAKLFTKNEALSWDSPGGHNLSIRKWE